MCGRLNVTSDPVGQLILEITGRGFVIEPRYNVAPTEDIPVILQSGDGEWDIRDMRWWLVPYWSDGPSNRYAMFNAKSETVSGSRAFREPFAKRRCIIPASGYYEWRKEGAQKVPFYMTPEDGGAFAFAGLWDRWRRDDQVIESCTIITTAAPEPMTSIHNRMPVQLTRDEVAAWVNADTDAESLKAMMNPRLKFDIRVTPVSTIVNNARNKDERCVEPISEPWVIH